MLSESVAACVKVIEGPTLSISVQHSGCGDHRAPVGKTTSVTRHRLLIMISLTQVSHSGKINKLGYEPHHSSLLPKSCCTVLSCSYKSICLMKPICKLAYFKKKPKTWQLISLLNTNQPPTLPQ
uniref:Uncharacterized protein n=1 Tax=Micrurus lemniscatus lemniscatus TaxID=129467 RepID=A0A2D4IIJ1_MICLE